MNNADPEFGQELHFVGKNESQEKKGVPVISKSKLDPNDLENNS